MVAVGEQSSDRGILCDQELVQSCLKGEAGAWDALVERYSRLIYSIPNKMGLSETDCDDVFQSVMTIILRRLSDLRQENRVSAWIIRTTYRESWRHSQRVRRARGAALEENSPDIGEPSEEQALRLERQQLVRQAMQGLEDRCRSLIHAFFFEAQPTSYEELAVQLGMPVGSIGPTRARCFKKLEKLLKTLGM